MPRQMLTDEYWVKLKPIILELGVYTKPSKVFFIGYGWMSLTGFARSIWFWNAVYKRFNDWSRKDKLVAIFNALVIVKAHQHSSGAQANETAIGKSVAGNTTKIHMAVDACGLPIHF